MTAGKGARLLRTALAVFSGDLHPVCLYMLVLHSSSLPNILRERIGKLKDMTYWEVLSTSPIKEIISRTSRSHIPLQRISKNKTIPQPRSIRLLADEIAFAFCQREAELIAFFWGVGGSVFIEIFV